MQAPGPLLRLMPLAGPEGQQGPSGVRRWHSLRGRARLAHL